MSNRALRRLRGKELEIPDLPNGVLAADNHKDSDIDYTDGQVAAVGQYQLKKTAKIANPYELLNEDKDGIQLNSDSEEYAEVTAVHTEESPASNRERKKKKRKKKKGKVKSKEENIVDSNKEAEDDIEASLREVNRLLGHISVRGEGEINSHTNDKTAADLRSLLFVEHKNLNPDTELRRIFGSRVIQAEQSRRRMRMRGRQRISWLTQPKENWPALGKTGLSMRQTESKGNDLYFVFEHSPQYQEVQIRFYDAVESLNPQNIANILQEHPYHIDALIQLSEVFRMSEDMQMASELIERAMLGMEMAFHPMFSLTTGTSRLEFKRRENRALYLALFKHITNIGQRGCYRTALEFCKLLLSLDPVDDPMCVLLMIDFYALRAKQYDYLIKLFEEWEGHRNLSQLPNFAFSVSLAMFQLNQEGGDLSKADAMLQKNLLMFPSFLMPLLDKCSIQPDKAVAAHPFFGPNTEYSQPSALKQLIALYIGRCKSCWKEPEVVTWLERNVKATLQRVDAKDPLLEDYKSKRLSRYQGTPRNIYRHILISEVPDATTTLPPDVASTVLSYDPLPPLDSVSGYSRPDRPRRPNLNGNPLSLFLRSLLPNFNPDVPVLEAEGAVGGQRLRQGVGALMDAMRDLLNNIRPIDPPVENQHGEEEEENDFEDD
ncbi:hypothetical protein CHS0354_018110 [Potamilus streckersoni]|uniref:Transcription factor 25 n=1 Tax=Potamilus streckersoni TaxID=2493646 RepID=A0AAE0STX6_9BIVA|nr:hypothetical protein CHS0354_018110 [Potamilus streckersoni]